MKLSEETLMKFADGELAPAEREAVEAALASDPESAARVAALRAQRAALTRAFDGVLQEPVPERLLAAARTAPAAGGTVAGLDRARAQHVARARARWSLPQWSAMAASLIVGILVGQLALRPDDAALVAPTDAGLVARGALAKSLTERLSGDSAGDALLAVGLSYRAKNGEYCRAFSMSREALAGVACRAGDTWRVQVLAPSEASAEGGYRLAGAALPPLIVQAVEAQIDGEPLDASAEASARSRGWRE